MHVTDAYNALTEQGKRRALRGISALLSAEKLYATQDDARQIVTGADVPQRLKTDEVARIVSGYFRGQIGMDVPPTDVFAEVSHAG